MLIRQLLAAVLETTANGVVNLKPEQVHYLAPLNGQSLQLQLMPLALPVVLYFSQSRIDLTIPPQPLPDEDVDCSVKVAISALDKIRDTNQLTKLIKADKLDFQGDLGVLQKLSTLLKQLDTSLPTLLEPVLGKQGANALIKLMQTSQEQLALWAENTAVTLSEGLIEEKQLIASPVAIANYCDEVSELRDAAERLTAKINRFEQYQRANRDE